MKDFKQTTQFFQSPPPHLHGTNSKWEFESDGFRHHIHLACFPRNFRCLFCENGVVRVVETDTAFWQFEHHVVPGMWPFLPLPQVLPVISPRLHFPDPRFQSHLLPRPAESLTGLPWGQLFQPSVLHCPTDSKWVFFPCATPMHSTSYTLSHSVLTAIQQGGPLPPPFCRWEHSRVTLCPDDCAFLPGTGEMPWILPISGSLLPLLHEPPSSLCPCTFCFSRPAVASTAGSDLSLNCSPDRPPRSLAYPQKQPCESFSSPTCRSHLPNWIASPQLVVYNRCAAETY